MCDFRVETEYEFPKSLFQQFLDVENRWQVQYFARKGVYNERENDRECIRAEDKKKGKERYNM